MVQNKCFKLVTYGCQMNKYDSETITAILTSKGYSLTDDFKEANIILINTCTVRQHAEDKVYSLLGKLFKIKHHNPSLKIGICGCLAQQDGDKLLKKFPSLDLVVGPDNIYKLADLLDKIYNDERIALTEHTSICVNTPLPKRVDKIKAYVPISLGCDNWCSYCVVPYTRGSLKSRNPQEILNEIKKLVKLGYVEITLLGQNVNDYLYEFNGKRVDFLELLILVNEIDGLKRIRFITSHPKNFSVELIDTLPKLEKVCEYIHLPIQSGSNKILKLMNRGYTVEFYKEIVKYIRQKIQNVSITTDLIVGFPGEEEEDFEQTVEVVKEIRFDSAFTFKFSPRPNTKAFTFPNQLSEEVKQDRLNRLIEVTSKITRQKNQELIGKIEEILIEGKNPKDPSSIMGRTRTDKIVFSKANISSLIGNLVKVKLISCGTFSFKAELIGDRY